MRFTIYYDFFKINNNVYLFNTNNGALIQLDKDSEKKIISCIKDDNLSSFTDEEINTLKSQEFLVDNKYYNTQVNINKLSYNLAKYNLEKDSIKIDFAITNSCNFNCPYCFESVALNKTNNINHLLETSNKVYKYIANNISNLKTLTIVYYGGEPTLENKFILNFNKKISHFCKKKNVKYKFNIITNGYLLSESFLKKLNKNECDFIQVTLDGTKDFHDERRTNRSKIKTFDRIINNINKALAYGLKVVIRLNIDKTNYNSIEKLICELPSLINQNYFGTLLFIDLARVFDSKSSFNLFDFEIIRQKLYDVCIKLNLIIPRIGAKNLTTFCIAESVSKDMVVDCFGNVYRCWNNVFQDSYAVNNIDNILSKNSTYETTQNSLHMVEDLSLVNTNFGKCFKCKYVKYCQGLCPKIRESILNGREMNIYKNDICKKIIHLRLENEIKGSVL